MKDSQEKVPLSPFLVRRLEIALACGVVLELSENLHLKCLPLGRHATRANYGCHYYPVGNEKLDAFICFSQTSLLSLTHTFFNQTDGLVGYREHQITSTALTGKGAA